MKTNSKTLKEIRNELNLSQLEMANVLGIDRATYLRYEKENSFPDKKENAYFQLIANLTKRTLKSDVNMEIQEIPLYDIEATAGVKEIFTAEENNLAPINYIKIPNLPKCDGAMEISGDSMYPILKSGDIILYKILNDKRNIIWGEMYIVYVKSNGDEFLLTKYLQISEQEGYIKLVSQNSHHSPVEFPIDSVLYIAQIKASIRMNSKI